MAREQPADCFCSDERVMDIKWVHGTHRQINSISSAGPAAFREQRFNKYATARPTQTIRNIKRSFVSLSLLFPLFSPFFLSLFLSLFRPALSFDDLTPLCSKLHRQIFGGKTDRFRDNIRRRVIIFSRLSNLPFLSFLFFSFSRNKF